MFDNIALIEKLKNLHFPRLSTMFLLDNLVWSVFISPRDRTLKSDLILCTGGDDDSQKVNVRLYNIQDKINTNNVKSKYLAKYYLARPDLGDESAVRKLLVIFPGRNSNFCQKNNARYAERFYKTKKLDDFDIAVIIYPRRAQNLVQLTSSCELAMRQILTEHGYMREYVSVMGWCIGAYFATEVLRQLTVSSNPEESKFKHFINYKSFSSLSEFLYCVLPKYTRFLLRFNPIKHFVNKWNVNSALSLHEFDCRFEKILVIFSDHDRIVRSLAHLHNQVNERLFANLSIVQDSENDSHFINWIFLANLLSDL